MFEEFELSSEPMLRDVKTLTQKAPTSVRWCARRVKLPPWRKDVTCH